MTHPFSASNSPPKRVLFLSNGHGEDLNASLVLKAFTHAYPMVEVAAMPIVGEGNAYKRFGVKIIGPTHTMPSGGIFYMNPLYLVKDVWAGLIGLTWQQIQAVLKYSRQCDLIFAAGDIVVVAIAHLTGRPYTAFIVSTSSYYEGRLRLPGSLNWLLRSRQCLQVFTRDAFTARDLNQRGLAKAIFAGYPIMDVLYKTGQDLHLETFPETSLHVPTIALLPGSRLPEACNNLGLQLELVGEIVKTMIQEPVQFRVALVRSITESELQAIAVRHQWQYLGNGQLQCEVAGQKVRVLCYYDALADILHQCDLAVGMAGTAVEQAVGLGKPVIQIPGAGPQFTYRFAEAQQRLLGASVQTIGTTPATPATLREAAQAVKQTLQDAAYRQACVKNGQERVGPPGGSDAIAHHLATHLFK